MKKHDDSTRNADEMANKPMLVRMICNIETGRWQDVLRFRCADGTVKNELFDRAIFSNRRRLHEALLQLGADIPKSATSANPILDDIVEQTGATVDYVVSSNGWFEDDFVAGQVTYGSGRKPALSPLDPKSPLGLQKGDIKTYLAGLRPLLLRSRFARLGMALQCSSVIWGKINRKESAIFHPFGDSGEGKSFCASIAMSIVGRAEKEDLGNHATSLAGFERVLALLKNLLAIFDELGLTEDDSERVQVGKLVKMAFAFASGHGRTLAASAWGVGIKSSTWHQYGLSTGEESLQEIAQRCAIKLKPGLTRRWIDIPSFRPHLKEVSAMSSGTASCYR